MELAFLKPPLPIIRIYIQLIGNMPALPNGAAETAEIDLSPPQLTIECPGR